MGGRDKARYECLTIEGNITEHEFRSFVGQFELPTRHGMTIGEYAKMLVGEQWIDSAVRMKTGRDFKLTVITYKKMVATYISISTRSATVTGKPGTLAQIQT